MMNGLFVICILILISAFFSVSEIALAAARKHKLQQMSEEGDKRADLVLAGCAILEEIRLAFPAQRIRVADRGLREGILTMLMKEDGTYGGAA